jgi:hypothetical protein
MFDSPERVSEIILRVQELLHEHQALTGFRYCEDLKDAEPDTLRYRVWHLPARLVRHAGKGILKISPNWPWKDVFLTRWQRLCGLPAPS